MKNTSEAMKFSWLDSIKSIYYLLDSKRKPYLFYTIILILVLFYDFVPTIVIAKIVDFFTTYTQGQSLTPFYNLILFLAISSAIVSFIRLSVKKRLANIAIDAGYFARVKGFEKLLDFSIRWHDNENTGNKVQRIQAGSDALKVTMRMLSQEVFLHITSFVGVLAAFLFFEPVFFIISVIYIIIFWSIQMAFYKKIEEMNYENNILLEKAGGTYFEGLNNILTIKTLGVKDDFKKNINSQEERSRDYSIKKVELMNNKWKFFQIINAVALGTILFYAGHNYVSGVITLGTIFIIYNYFWKLNRTISDSTDTLDKLITSKTTFARMMPIFWEKPTVTGGDLPFPSQWNSLELKNVLFNYPLKENNKEEVTVGENGLNDVSLRVMRNEKVGIVGRSGSGKSTLAKILLGLYEVQGGNYAIGNVDFYKIKHEGVTQTMALVLQDSEMFNLSLKENITLMRSWNQELFDKAASICQLEELIAKLPNGVNTLIGEKGYRLSGGERQRIGIARAIYKDPEILVLDEATSSLDNKTEWAIQRAIETKLAEKTIITIAHRTSTLKNMDRIIVFENGNIVEEGTFAGLSGDSSSKFSIVNAQEGKSAVNE